MPPAINSFVFRADYSNISSCLFAIQVMGDNGGFAGDEELLRLLGLLEGDAIRKLYNTVIRILGHMQGIVITTGQPIGDFENIDFWAIDFNVGFADTGDFEYWDFSDYDFNVGIIDLSNNSYSAQFQTILNIFGLFGRYIPGLTDEDLQSLNNAFIAFLDAFYALRNYLILRGLNPCINVPQYFNNSPSLYLQTAGADGTHGVPEGIHLRWSFAGDLGINHIPQGDYYNASSTTPTGYNKTNDYVVLSRTPYVNPMRLTIDLETTIPAINYASLQWSYILNMVSGSQNINNTIRFTFKDALLYNDLALSTDPQTNPFSFLKAYNGLLEIAIDNKTAFAIGYDFRLQSGTDSSTLKVQAISTINGAETININKTITAASSTPVTGTIFGDNTQKLQLQKSFGGYLHSLSFETYDDFVNTRSVADWTVVGSDFALSLTDQTVFDRLETSAYPIDNLWPQYNSGTKVKVENYHKKWLDTHPNDISIKAAVQHYLLLSETDPRAMDTVKDDGVDITGLTISYLDTINLMALDYHWARMLGFGHIDTEINNLGNTQFIYKISYINRQNSYSNQMVAYEYMSIPTGKSDSRLPETPIMRPVNYTLPGNDSSKLFDSNGYSTLLHERVINIGRQLYNFELKSISFFDDATTANDFNIFENTTSILYGIKYRSAHDTAYTKPEITNSKLPGFKYYAYDPDFPVDGVLETVPVPDDQTCLYVHFETQPGIHNYAIYGINWFARASVISTEQQTDETAFPPQNTLMPPTALAAQYIQKEDTLLFTTTTEQDWLSGRAMQFPGEDINFTRVTFNWLDISDISNFKTLGSFDLSAVVRPTRVKAWFKPSELLQVVGIITNILPVSGYDNLTALHTGGYTLLDGTTVINPAIGAADMGRFNGSLLSTTEGQFTVSSIIGNPFSPIIIIEKIVQTSTVEDPANPGYYATNSTYTLPAIGSRFSIAENLRTPDNWQPIVEDIQLIDYINPADPATESSVDEYGNITRNLVGGIWASAVVSQLLNTLDHSVMPGYYSVTFNPAINMAPHPQANLPFDPANPATNAPGTLQSPFVDWYNGLVRLPVAGSTADKKLVNVIRIVQTNPLTLYIYDGAYQDDTIQISASPTDLINNVNYHPGYKAYLYPEPAPANTFNGSNMLPGASERFKKTMIALQTTDTGTGGTGFSSWLSPPAILLATKILEPVQLPAPLTYGLKVRPDATTKAAFTFDTKLLPDSSGQPRSPFGFMFYRTTNEDLLHALYAPATVNTILNQLAGLTVDEHFNQRYVELANLTFDPAHPGHFNVFDATPDPYGFPVPDIQIGSSGNIHTILPSEYETAIISTLLPLTAQTPILTYIKNGTQTENKLPTIKTVDGNLMDPNDPLFDPFPMIRKYPGGTDEPNTSYIRFTDYSLNGSSRFLYFYSSTEVTDKLVIGPISPFSGPVTVLHTLHADAPVIRYFTLAPPTTISTSPIAVTFFITPFAPDDTITKVRIYRALDSDNALSLQTMDSFVDVDVVADTQNGIITIDDFSDLPFAPVGETVYYRLAFIRIIINERDETEDVIGLGSDIVTVRLIDTVNPQAPDLTYVEADNKLTWPPTTNKGTYYLYQQTIRGNWQKIYSTTDTLEYILANPLTPTDDDGNPLYYRFKVKVENSSGLLNLVDNELTI